MSLRRGSLTPLIVVALVAGGALPSTATPVCTGDVPKAACLGRTVPEPETTSATFLTVNEFWDVLDDLHGEFPGWLTFGSMGTSVDGHDIPIVEITNPQSPVPLEDRRVVYVSQSIHGNEVGGREGMIRIIEDLLRKVDPDTTALLDQVRLVQYVPNPDGWVRGDWDRPGSTTFTRGNGNGTDLNRQFPWRGWIPASRSPVSEPEAQAVVDDVEERRGAGEEIVASVDIHGMLQNDAAVWSMHSSGEFDLGGIIRQRTHGQSVAEAVEEALSPRALFILGQAAGDAVTPHVLTSSSEFQGGLSGSGFLGDWLAQEDGAGSASLSTIELFHNQPPQSFVYAKEIAQIHVDSVRAIVRALMEEAVRDLEVSVNVPGTIGYLVDPLTVEGATPMAFFEDLAPYLDEPLRRIELEDFTDPEQPDPLEGLESLVVTSDLVLDDAEVVQRIGSFVESGGNLVATDAGLTLLAQIDPEVTDAAVSSVTTRISNADFQDLDHPMAANVRDNALHLYEPATLGYNPETGPTQAPVWRVARTTFDEAGATVATTDGETSVGVRTLGDGTVHVIGGLLPPPTTINNHPFGLSDYAVVDTSMMLFLNSIGGELLVTQDPGRNDPCCSPAS